MKLYKARKKDGTPIKFSTWDRYIIHNGEPILDLIRKIKQGYDTIKDDGVHQFQILGFGTNDTRKYDWEINSGTSKYRKKNIVCRYKGGVYMNTDEVIGSTPVTPMSKHFFRLDRPSGPMCLFRVNGSTVTSEYGINPDILITGLRNYMNWNVRDINWTEIIRDNDYFELVIDGYLYTMRLNFNMYYDYSYGETQYRNSVEVGPNGYTIPYHIDAISDEIIPLESPIGGNNVSQVLNHDAFFNNPRHDSNVTTLCGLINPLQQTNIYKEASAKLEVALFNNTDSKVPLNLFVLKEKYCRMSDRNRYSTEAIDNFNNINIGKYWQPREAEIFGYPILSDKSRDAGSCMQYATFRINGSRRKYASQFNENSLYMKPSNYGKYTTWSFANDSYGCIYIDENGIPRNTDASPIKEPISHLLCFRIV